MGNGSNALKWSDEFSVGIDEIDEQHKTLFVLVNDLSTAIHEKHGSAVCKKILDELVDYTRIHFALEESLMRLAKYPGFEEHKRSHGHLIEDVGTLQAKIKDGRAAISFELLQFLRVWLTRHILQSDQDYARYYSRRKFDDLVAPAPQCAESAMPRRAWWKFWQKDAPQPIPARRRAPPPAAAEANAVRTSARRRVS